MQYERGSTYRQPRRLIALKTDWATAVLFDHLLSLQTLFDRSRTERDGEHWFYRSNEQLCAYMGVGNRALMTMRKRLEALELIRTKTFKRTKTGKRCLHFAVDIEGLGRLMQQAAPQNCGAQIDDETKCAERRFGNVRSADLVGGDTSTKETELRNKTPPSPPLGEAEEVFEEISRQDILKGRFDGKPKTTLSRNESLIRALVREWSISNRKEVCLPTPGRRAKLQAALRNGYAPSLLLKALEGIALSPHHRGENDRGRAYNEVSNVCAKDNIENFSALWDNHIAPRIQRGDVDAKPRLFQQAAEAQRAVSDEWTEADQREMEAALGLEGGDS